MATILIVDDDQDILNANQFFLEKEGFEVETANTRKNAESLLAAKRFDIIILDVMMEQADDGIVIAQECRRQGIQTPIIMLTAINHALGLELDKGDLLPVDEFLTKPIEPSALIKKVNEILSKGDDHNNA